MENHNLTSNLLINICLHHFPLQSKLEWAAWTYITLYLGVFLKGELMSHREYAFVVFKDSAKLFLHWSFNNIPSHQQCMRFPLSSQLSQCDDVLSYIWILSAWWMKMVFDAVLICIFPYICILFLFPVWWTIYPFPLLSFYWVVVVVVV